MLPVLAIAAVYYPFVLEIRRSAFSAFCIVLVWAILLSLLILFFSVRYRERMRAIIWRGEEYSKSMFDWIQTDHLTEG